MWNARVEEHGPVGAKHDGAYYVSGLVVKHRLALPFERPFRHRIPEQGETARPRVVPVRLTAQAMRVAVGVLADDAQGMAGEGLAPGTNGLPHGVEDGLAVEVHLPERVRVPFAGPLSEGPAGALADGPGRRAQGFGDESLDHRDHGRGGGGGHCAGQNATASRSRF